MNIQFFRDVTIRLVNDPWCGLLMEWTVKSSLVLALAALVVTLMWRAPAAWRHVVWSGAIASLPCLLICSIALPDWNVLPHVALVSSNTLDETPVSEPSVNEEQLAEPLDASAQVAEVKADAPASEPPANQGASSPGTPSPGQAVSLPIAPSRPVIASRHSVFAVWLLGVGIFVLPIVLGLVGLGRLRKRRDQIALESSLEILRSACKDLGVRRPVTLLQSHGGTMPMQWGISRPTILLPKEAEDWSEPRLRAVLLHELAHIARLDCLVHVLVRLVAALQWFNPLVWMALKRQAHSGELACDDAALRAGCRPADYAEHVLEVASSCRTPALAATATAIARPSTFERRLLAILDGRRRRDAASRLAMPMVFALFAMGIVPLAMLHAAEPSGTAVSGPVGKYTRKPVWETKPHNGDHEITKPVWETTADVPYTVTKPAWANAAMASYTVTKPFYGNWIGWVDETAESKKSLGGSGHAVQFDRPESQKYIAGVRVYCSRYGYPQAPDEDFFIYIMDEKHKVLKEVAVPYARVERGNERWYTFPTPVIEVPEKFHVALSFNPHQTKGIFLSYDSNVQKSHSLTGTPSAGFEPIKEKYDWMVRAAMTNDPEAKIPGEPAQGSKKPSSSANAKGYHILCAVDDSAEGKRSMAGSGHAIQYDRPDDQKYVAAVGIHCSRYGLSQAPAEDFHIYILDQDRKVIKDVGIPYSRVQRGAEHWYTFAVPRTEVPKRFYIALAFNPHQTKGIYMSYDGDVSRTRSLVGTPKTGFTPVREKYDWMIRVALSNEP